SLPSAETALADAPRRSRAARTEPALGPEMALSRHVVHLDADPVGILEEHRVVSGREARLLRRVDDARAQLVGNTPRDRVDVLSRAGAEAEMVEAGAALVEPAAAPRVLVGAHEDARAAADAVHDAVGLDERLHLEEVAKFLPEGDARGIDDGEL